jgi:outer membrane protein assembly factor BamB
LSGCNRKWGSKSPSSAESAEQQSPGRRPHRAFSAEFVESNPSSGQYIAWSLPQGGPYVPSPIIYGGLYYALPDAGFLTCHDAKTGKAIYGKQRIDPASGSFTSSPWAYNNRIFCLSEDGDAYVIRAGPEFEVLGKNSIGDTCLASPAIADGSLMLRTLSHLYRISGPG